MSLMKLAEYSEIASIRYDVLLMTLRLACRVSEIKNISSRNTHLDG